jgi:hypothetical protein
MPDVEAEVENNMGDEIPADFEMAGDEVIQVDTGATMTNGGQGENVLPFQDEEEEVLPPRITFVDHLRSPVVELLVGEGERQTLLTAHQALLVQSRFFEDACSQSSDNTAVWITQAFCLQFMTNQIEQRRRIELRNENLDAVGCFLEYIYTGEYFPQKIAGQRGLAKDSTMPELDETGEQLLKHARVYTLADKLGMVALKTLAHSKIHCVKSCSQKRSGG